MRSDSKSYDPELQMFVDGPREPDLARLCFLRWLVEHGKLEHGVAGIPGGPYALAATIERRLAA
jgi:hypothetical protein